MAVIRYSIRVARIGSEVPGSSSTARAAAGQTWCEQTRAPSPSPLPPPPSFQRGSALVDLKLGQQWVVVTQPGGVWEEVEQRQEPPEERRNRRVGRKDETSVGEGGQRCPTRWQIRLPPSGAGRDGGSESGLVGHHGRSALGSRRAELVSCRSGFVPRRSAPVWRPASRVRPGDA
eukprot:2252483-Rhodomonas_salina.1